MRRVPSPDNWHRVSYQVIPPVDPTPEYGAVLATVEHPLGVGVAEPRSAGTWWRLLRPAITVLQRGSVYTGEFSVEVELEGTYSARGVAGHSKPLLDGLISALHVHRPAPAWPDEPIQSRLALLGDPEDLWELLTDDSAAVLGARSLVKAGTTNLVWNPATTAVRRSR